MTKVIAKLPPIPKEWEYEFEERAAMMEHYGGLSQEDAELAAYDLEIKPRVSAAIPMPVPKMQR